MFILRDILLPLQQDFSDSRLGRIRSRWFVHVILACITPFTSSMSSNLLRTLTHLFGLQHLTQRAFYAFMASSMIPWSRMWTRLWRMIPNPETDGRLLLALDDCTNPKVGKKVFGASHVFDHAAKTNQSKYPWAQCFTCIGLLKKVKGRWICLPLIHRFYLPEKALDANRENMKVRGKTPVFHSKLEQAMDMLVELSACFFGLPAPACALHADRCRAQAGASILVVCDSWFGNKGLFAPGRKMIGASFHMLSRLRCNIILYAMPPVKAPGQRRGNAAGIKNMGIEWAQRRKSPP